MRMPVTKTSAFTRATAAITLACFLYSSVFSQTAYALAEERRTAEKIAASAADLLIPGAFGKVSEFRDYGSRDVIVAIQDLHCHAEVQKNISRILASLDQKYHLNTVYVEGAYGQVDTSWLCSMQDRKLKETIRDTLLGQGKLTGAEYYSVTANRPLLLKGLEDEKLHKENLLRLGRILERQEAYGRLLHDLQDDLHLMQVKHFSSKSAKFHDLTVKYRDGKIPAEKYYRLLRKYADDMSRHPERYSSPIRVSMDDYPSLRTYLELTDLSGRLNYRKVSRQLQRFIARLKTRAPYASYRELLEKTRNQAGLEEVYALLPRYAKTYAIDLPSDYPDLTRFLVYTEKNRSLNPVSLISEERMLTGAVRAGLARDTAELDVAFLSDFMDYFSDYLLNRLSADGYDYFAARFDKFKHVWGRYDYHDRLSPLTGDFSILDEYYKVNCSRNTCFIGKLQLNDTRAEKRLETSVDPGVILSQPGSRVHVLVAGGFHTQGISKLLDGRGTSFIIVTPNATTDTAFSSRAYTDFARQQARLLSQAFALGLASQMSSTEQFEMALNAARRELASVHFNEANFNRLISTLHNAVGEKTKAATHFSPEGATITFANGRTINFTKNDATGSFIASASITREFRAASREAVEQLVRIINQTEVAVEDMIGLVGMIPGTYAALRGLMAFAAKHDLILGNGLIYELSNDEDMLPIYRNKLDNLSDDIIARFPEFGQKMVAERHGRSIRLDEAAGRSKWLKSFVACDLARDLVLSADALPASSRKMPLSAYSSNTGVIVPGEINTLAKNLWSRGIITPDITAITRVSEDLFARQKSAPFLLNAGSPHDLTPSSFPGEISRFCSSKNIGITGATGGLGTALIRRLIKENPSIQINVLMRQTTRQRPAWEKLQKRFSSNITIIEGDLMDPEALRTLVKRSDALFHLALDSRDDFTSMVPGGDDKSREILISNTVPGAILSTLAAEQGKPIVFSSSYGIFFHLAQPADKRQLREEDIPLGKELKADIAEYVLLLQRSAKALAEGNAAAYDKALMAIHKQVNEAELFGKLSNNELYAVQKLINENILTKYGTAAAIRIGNLYGPGDAEGRPIPALIESVKAEKQEIPNDRRSYVFMDNVAEAFIRAAVLSDKMMLSEKDRVITVAYPEVTDSVTAADIIRQLISATKSPNVKGEQFNKNLELDLGRMRNILKMGPDELEPLKDGLQRTITPRTDDVRSIYDIKRRNVDKQRILFYALFGDDFSFTGESAGVDAISGFMRHNHKNAKINILDMQLDTIDDVMWHIKSDRPAIFAVSVKLKTYDKLQKLCRRIYSEIPSGQRPLIVIGGTLPTYVTESILREDLPDLAIVVGEGELSIEDIYLYVNGSKNLDEIRNIIYVDDNGAIHANQRVIMPPQLFTAPDRRRTLEFYKKGGIVYAEQSRGCPWGICSICASAEVLGSHIDESKWRPLPLNVVMDDLDNLARKGVEVVRFTDEDFLGRGKEGIERAMAFADEKLRRRNKVKFDIMARVDSVYDEDESPSDREARTAALKRLKEAGLIKISLGVESFSHAQLRRYIKGVTTDEIANALAIIRKLNIPLGIGFIPCDPLTSLEQLEESLRGLIEADALMESSVTFNELRVQEGGTFLKMVRAMERKTGKRILGLLDKNSLNYPVEHYLDNRVDMYVKALRDLYNRKQLYAIIYNLRIYTQYATHKQSFSRNSLPSSLTTDKAYDLLKRIRMLDYDLSMALIRELKSSGATEAAKERIADTVQLYDEQIEQAMLPFLADLKKANTSGIFGENEHINELISGMHEYASTTHSLTRIRFADISEAITWYDKVFIPRQNLYRQLKMGRRLAEEHVRAFSAITDMLLKQTGLSSKVCMMTYGSSGGNFMTQNSDTDFCILTDGSVSNSELLKIQATIDKGLNSIPGVPWRVSFKSWDLTKQDALGLIASRYVCGNKAVFDHYITRNAETIDSLPTEGELLAMAARTDIQFDYFSSRAFSQRLKRFLTHEEMPEDIEHGNIKFYDGGLRAAAQIILAAMMFAGDTRFIVNLDMNTLVTHHLLSNEELEDYYRSIEYLLSARDISVYGTNMLNRRNIKALQSFWHQDEATIRQDYEKAAETVIRLNTKIRKALKTRFPSSKGVRARVSLDVPELKRLIESGSENIWMTLALRSDLPEEVRLLLEENIRERLQFGHSGFLDEMEEALRWSRDIQNGVPEDKAGILGKSEQEVIDYVKNALKTFHSHESGSLESIRSFVNLHFKNAYSSISEENISLFRNIFERAVTDYMSIRFSGIKELSETTGEACDVAAASLRHELEKDPAEQELSKLDKALSIDYSAYLFDIDGTLKDYQQDTVPGIIIKKLVDLLMYDKYVVIATGRFYDSNEWLDINPLVADIKADVKRRNLPEDVLKWLYAITESGSEVYNISTGKNVRNFREKIPPLSNAEKSTLIDALAKAANKYNLTLTKIEDKGDYSFGCIFNSEILSRNELYRDMQDIIKHHSLPVNLYFSKSLIDVQARGIDKSNGIAYLRDELGIPDDLIAAVGDAGDLSGNDYRITNRKGGFSVQHCSGQPHRQQIDVGLATGLKNVNGTEFLLDSFCKTADSAKRAAVQAEKMKLQEALDVDYRAFLFDVDGTLKNHAEDIPESIIERMVDLLACSRYVVITTGRLYDDPNKHSVKPIITRIQNAAARRNLPESQLHYLLAITETGAAVYDTAKDKVVHDFKKSAPRVPEHERDSVIMALRKYANETGMGERKIEIKSDYFFSYFFHGFINQRRKFYDIVSRIISKNSVPLNIYVGARVVDFTSHAIDKFNAVTYLEESLGIPQYLIAAIGDAGDIGGNDHHITNRKGGFSVQYCVDTHPREQIDVPLATGLQNETATEYLLDEFYRRAKAENMALSSAITKRINTVDITLELATRLALSLTGTTPVLQPIAGATARFSSEILNNKTSPVVINWHYVRSSDIFDATSKYGVVNKSDDGQIFVNGYILDRIPDDHGNTGWKNTGLSINGKPVWVSTMNGIPVFYFECRDASVSVRSLEAAFTSKGYMDRSRTAIGHFKEAIKSNGIEAGNRYFVPGLMIDHTSRGKFVSYSNGTVIADSDYFETDDGIIDPKAIAAKAGTLLSIKDAESFAMGRNLLLYMDKGFNPEKNVETVFRLRGQQIIVDGIDTAKAVQNKLCELQKDRRTPLRIKVYAKIKDQSAIPACAQNGLSGCIVERAGQLEFFDFAYSKEHGIRAGMVSGRNIDEIATALHKLQSPCCIIKVSGISEALAKDHDIIDKANLVEMLGNEVLTFLGMQAYSDRFVRDVVYGTDATRFDDPLMISDYLNIMRARLETKWGAQWDQEGIHEYTKLENTYRQAIHERELAEKWIKTNNDRFMPLTHKQMLGTALALKETAGAVDGKHVSLEAYTLTDARINEAFSAVVANPQMQTIDEFLAMLRLFDTELDTVQETTVKPSDIHSVANILKAA